jgi:twinkle protein
MANFLIDDEIDFSQYLVDTDAHANVKPASSYTQALKNRLRGRKLERFVFLPWEKTMPCFDFRSGEVTIWAGYNGHGKSLVTSQVALSLMGQGEKVCIASFEMKPVTTMQRMARMFCATNPFSPEYLGEEGIQILESMYDEFGGWTDNHLWLYDQTGTTDSQKVLGMAKYCAKELGIKHIFIDNLAKCVKGDDDYNGQKSFVDQATSIARDLNCHIHIVHHLKKPPKETERPDKSDVKGSGTIVDQPDNLFLVWRNKAKEDERKEGKSTRSSEPDTMLYCRKQRNYEGSDEGEPSIALWWHRDSGQFLGNAEDQPMFFPNWPHRQTAGY